MKSLHADTTCNKNVQTFLFQNDGNSDVKDGHLKRGSLVQIEITLKAIYIVGPPTL